MKVRGEKLGKFITAMNNEEAHVFLIEELAAVREQYSLDREEDRWVEVKNGRSKKMLLKEVAANTHDAVCEIKEDIQPIRDINGFFAFMKKYKLWYVVGLMVGYILASIGLDVTLVNIKNHLP